MESDHDNIQVGLHTSQATLLLEGLEALRNELGPIGEDLIALLRDAGVSTLSEPDSLNIEETGQ